MPTTLNTLLPYASAAGVIPSAPKTSTPNTLGQFYTNTGIGTGSQVGTAQLNPTATTTTPPPPTRDPHINPASGVWDDEYYARNNVPDDMNRLIEDTYNSSNNYLNQAESTLKENYAGVPGQLEENFNYNSGLAGTQRDRATTELNMYGDKAAYQNEDALAASRRLYSELRQGAQQRFGGASSAGEASSEILGREQQRQQGATQRTYQDLSQQINFAHTKINQDYDQAIKEFTRDKQAKLGEAKQNYTNKLLEISQRRAENDQAKGQAKIQALYDFKNKIFAIQQQELSFQQTLAAQRNQAALYLQNYVAQTASQTANAGSAYNSALSQPGFSTQPTSSFNGVQANPQQSASPYIGSINPTQRKDIYGNLLT